jgi:c-di-GMP-binding flagellar brake protein YcgR
MKERADHTSDRTSLLLVERRLNIRVPVHIQASVAGQNQTWHECTIVDISIGGAKISIDAIDPSEDTRVTVRFRLGTEYQLTAAVVWHRPAERSSHFIGVQWVNLSDSEQSQLILEIMRIAVNRRRRTYPTNHHGFLPY